MITDQKTIDALKELNYKQVYEKGKEDARQEILDKIEARCKGYFDKEYWHDYPAEPFNIIEELKQQLNQPKEEGKE